MTKPLLSLQSISLRYGGLIAIDDVSINVSKGQIYGVIGPNGAGKTSLFNCITSFSTPTSGTIELEGKQIDGMAPHVIASLGIARTYQNIRLFRELTAMDNVMVGEHPMINTSIFSILFSTKAFQREEREARSRSMAMLEWVGLKGRENIDARNLSYGEQRRLEIARALSRKPKVLLLDEPAAGMNPAEALALSALIRQIRDDLGVTVLLIEHHMDVVMTTCDHITVLDRGKVIATGAGREIQTNPRVVEAYLGRAAQKKFAETSSEVEGV